MDAKLDIHTETRGGLTETTFVSNDFFSVYKWDVDGKAEFVAKAPYTLVSILDGEAVLTIDGNEQAIKKGDHFVLPNEVKSWEITGQITAIVSTPPVK
ncbi:putative mannose-6-phosphate isomerase YvyI [Listeria monocytogenes]|nr:putative mannose-6-phosphate isomerase YvyI [Listeria monocytogenes]